MFERHHRSVLTLALVLACGCNGAAVDNRGDAEPGPPSWLASLPERTVTAASGETVWAVIPTPGSEAASLGAYLFESVEGARAVLIDGIDNRFEGVPGALVHPLSSFPEAELAPGAAAFASRWDAGAVVGRVAAVDAGKVELAYDWNGVTVTSALEAVMPLPAADGGLTLSWVGYRAGDAGGWSKGLCFAESDDRAWILADGGHVEIVAKGGVEPLVDLGRMELAAGDAVAAYSWGHGYRSGVIEDVLEPGLRYAVKLEGGETRPVFFDRLTAFNSLTAFDR